MVDEVDGLHEGARASPARSRHRLFFGLLGARPWHSCVSEEEVVERVDRFGLMIQHVSVVAEISWIAAVGWRPLVALICRLPDARFHRM
jgi:hypothetical protein